MLSLTSAFRRGGGGEETRVSQRVEFLVLVFEEELSNNG